MPVFSSPAEEAVARRTSSADCGRSPSMARYGSLPAGCCAARCRARRLRPLSPRGLPGSRDRRGCNCEWLLIDTRAGAVRLTFGSLAAPHVKVTSRSRIITGIAASWIWSRASRLPAAGQAATALCQCGRLRATTLPGQQSWMVFSSLHVELLICGRDSPHHNANAAVTRARRPSARSSQAKLIRPSKQKAPSINATVRHPARALPHACAARVHTAPGNSSTNWDMSGSAPYEPQVERHYGQHRPQPGGIAARCDRADREQRSNARHPSRSPSVGARRCIAPR